MIHSHFGLCFHKLASASGISSKRNVNPSHFNIDQSIDLEAKRQVSTSEGQHLADKCGILFFESSAKMNHNVDNAFRCLVSKVHQTISSSSLQVSKKTCIKVKGTEKEEDRSQICCLIQ